MHCASDFRRHAQDCIDLAETKGLTERATLLELAAEWLRLADHAEIEDVAGPTPLARIAPGSDTTQ